MKENEHRLLLIWVLFLGLAIFGAGVCTDRGWIRDLIATDQSKISLVLIGMFGVGLAHSLQRTWYLSTELKLTGDIETALRAAQNDALVIDQACLRTASGRSLPDGFVSRYVTELLATTIGPHAASATAESRAALLDAYALKIRGAHDFGWFLIDLLLKVGFLGTLIGFILMLGSISSVSDLDASMMRQVLQRMSEGMSTALNTTLVSLVGGIVLAIPYYLLDRGLEALLQRTVFLTEALVVPRLTTS